MGELLPVVELAGVPPEVFGELADGREVAVPDTENADEQPTLVAAVAEHAELTNDNQDKLAVSSAFGTFSLSEVLIPQRTSLSNQDIPICVSINLVRVESDMTRLNPVLVGESGFNPLPLASNNSLGIFYFGNLVSGLAELRRNHVIGKAASVLENAADFLNGWLDDLSSHMADQVAKFAVREQFFRRLGEEVKVSVVVQDGVLHVSVNLGFVDAPCSAQHPAGEPLAELVSALLQQGADVRMTVELKATQVNEFVTYGLESSSSELVSWITSGFSESEFFPTGKKLSVLTQTSIVGSVARVTTTFKE